MKGLLSHDHLKKKRKGGRQEGLLPLAVNGPEGPPSYLY